MDMKPILLSAIFLLSLAVPVGAEDSALQLKFDCRSDGCKEIRDYQTYCERKMEAAMKALHPFSMLNLDPVHEQIGLDLVKKRAEWDYRAELPYEDPAGFTLYGLTQTMNAKAGRAIVLWDSVKRDCWSH